MHKLPARASGRNIRRRAASVLPPRHARSSHDQGAPFAPLIDAKAAGRLRGVPHTSLLTCGLDRRRGMTYPADLRPAVARGGFFRRLARAVRSIGPPLTADQQLRLLQLALNVKLKREGKPPDSIRLTVVETLAAERDPVAAGPVRKRPSAPHRR